MRRGLANGAFNIMLGAGSLREKAGLPGCGCADDPAFCFFTNLTEILMTVSSNEDQNQQTVSSNEGQNQQTVSSNESQNQHLQAKVSEVIEKVGQVIVGQAKMVNRLLIGLFTQGHLLIEGVPGLAKTLTVNTLADALRLDFRRIQFTPDLLPADLIGTMIYNQQKSEFEVKKGPIFANLILADEINRSPAKVQSALLESMQEKQVTIGEVSHPLDKPFLVLATQNPIDQEGTYPLPEAQVDRFMMKVHIDYPSPQEELTIMRRMTDINFGHKTEPILSKDDIFAIRDEIYRITLSESLEKYIVELVYSTRDPKSYKLDDAGRFIQFGASPRASINLNLASKACAFLNKRNFVLPEDIKEMAPDVMNHRILLTYEAEAERVTTLQIIDRILEKIRISG